MDSSSIDLKKLLCVSSAPNEAANEKFERVSYSKETLMILSKNLPCQSRPDCLSPDCLGIDGLWDPEKWHQTFSSAPSSEGGRKHIEHHDVGEENNVVLGPQRRSFQGGCHVALKEKSSNSSTFTRSGLTSSGSKLSDRGLKISRQEDHEQHPHLKRFHSLQSDTNDWSKAEGSGKKSFEKLEPAYNRKSRNNDYKRFSSTSSSNTRYGDNSYQQSRHAYYEESEPEWISYGPKSQFDTVELSGFEEADDFSWMGGEIPMDDVPERKKKDSKNEKKTSDDEPTEQVEKEVILEKKEEETLEIELKNDNEKESECKSTDEPASTKEPEVSRKEDVAKEVPDTLSLDQEFFGTDAEANQGSRFSRWFNSESPLTPEQKMVNDLTSDVALEKEEQLLPNVTQIATRRLPEQQELKKPEAKQPSFSARPTDVHESDAFSRLIASIRASDQVKEKIQIRNQKMQALQNMVKVNADQQRNQGFNVTSIENVGDQNFKNLQSMALKQQFEKQKDVYQQKLRQIEQQQQKSSPTAFSGQDAHPLQGMLPGFSGPNAKDAVDERKAATASLAAKLAGKGKKDEPAKLPTNALVERLYSNSGQMQADILTEQALLERENLMKLKRLQSNPVEVSKSNSAFPPPNAAQNNLKNNSLVIAQMLAKAGVTEEQLKQLTLGQQELVISMVQNQFTQKDIGKFVNFEGRNNMKLPDNAAVPTKSQLPGGLSINTFGNPNVSKEMFTNKSLPTPREGRLSNAATASTTSNALSFLTDSHSTYKENNVHPGIAAHPSNLAQVSAAQSRLLPRNIMPIHPTIVSPVVPLISPNIAPHMITPTALAAPPHLTHLVQTPASLAPPHPALLLQMQQQLYANQLAAAQQQQQQAVLAAFQKQQIAKAQSNNAAKLQQSIQNMTLAATSRPGTSDASSAQDRTQFNNPLSQWFSRDVLQQSQFPPVSQLTGQQTMKLSNNPHGVESVVHTTKH